MYVNAQAEIKLIIIIISFINSYCSQGDWITWAVSKYNIIIGIYKYNKIIQARSIS